MCGEFHAKTVLGSGNSRVKDSRDANPQKTRHRGGFLSVDQKIDQKNYFFDLGFGSSKINVMRTVARYSTTLPFSTITFCSEIQALEIFFMVSDAREMPTCTASSNDLVDPAEISIIFATDIVTSFLIWVSPKGKLSIDQHNA